MGTYGFNRPPKSSVPCLNGTLVGRAEIDPRNIIAIVSAQGVRCLALMNKTTVPPKAGVVVIERTGEGIETESKLTFLDVNLEELIVKSGRGLKLKAGKSLEALTLAERFVHANRARVRLGAGAFREVCPHLFSRPADAPKNLPVELDRGAIKRELRKSSVAAYVTRPVATPTGFNALLFRLTRN